MFIGKVKDWSDLDGLIAKYNVRCCLIPPQPEPYLVADRRRRGRHRGQVYGAVYLSDGLSRPVWDHQEEVATVDRTYALNSAYEEIREQRWRIPMNAREIDGTEFYAQLKAPSQGRDLTTGALDHYRHAHAFDRVLGAYRGSR